MTDEIERTPWQEKARFCPETEGGLGFHNLLVIGWRGSLENQQATMVMCTQCLHHLNISDVMQERLPI